MKARLYYRTREPKHVRSLALASEYGQGPPYTEWVAVLVDPARIGLPSRPGPGAALEGFEPVFERLKRAGLVAEGDRLEHCELREDDARTLAYPI